MNRVKKIGNDNSISRLLSGRFHWNYCLKATAHFNVFNSFGLVDMFSWNPHCRNIDGSGSSGM